MSNDVIVYEYTYDAYDTRTSLAAFRDVNRQISLDKFIHFMRAGGLSESRRDVVHTAFRRLASANAGVLRLGDIRDACNFSSSSAVTSGWGTNWGGRSRGLEY